MPIPHHLYVLIKTAHFIISQRIFDNLLRKWKVYAMPKITEYDDLLKVLKKGESINIGSDNISPQLIDLLNKLALAPLCVLIEDSKIDDECHTSIIEGSGELFGIDGTHITIEFKRGDLGDFYISSICSSPPGDTEWELMENFRISDTNLRFEADLELEFYSASIDCTLLIGRDEDLRLKILVQIPSYKDDWRLIGDFEATPLSVNSLKVLTNGMEIKAFLPEPLRLINKFVMSSAELAFNPSEEIFSYIYFVVDYNDDWNILEDIICVNKGDIKLNFMVDLISPDNTYIELDSTFRIESIPINIGAHFAENNFYVWGKLANGSKISINKIFEHFKINFPQGFPEIDIIGLGLLVDISNKHFELHLESEIDAGSTFKISSLRADMDVDVANNVVDADFSAAIAIDDTIHLFLRAHYDGKGGGLKFKGMAENIEIGSFIGYLGREFGIKDIPEPLKSLTIKKLETSYDTNSGDFTFDVSGDIPVAEMTLNTEIRVKVEHKEEDQTAVMSLECKVTIGSAVFEISKQGCQGTKFTASWKMTNQESIGFKDIAKALVHTSPDIPDELDVKLDAASFTYYTDKHAFVLCASSINYGKATFVARKYNGSWQFFFGAAVGQTISLTDMPLIKSVVTQVACHDETVEIRDIQIVIASDDLDKTTASEISELIREANISFDEIGLGLGQWSRCLDTAEPIVYPTVPKDGMQKGIALSMTFAAGSFEPSLILSLTRKAALSEGESTSSALAVWPREASDLPPTPTSNGTVWYNLQKTFGPVTFQKVGIRYKDSMIYVLMNASLDAGGLNISVFGLGVGSPLTSFKPEFNIDGLAITFTEGPVEISGGMVGTVEPVNFYGELTLGFPSLTISALGGYSDLENHPSFFLYAVLNYPIGGPSFFFITGLAAGFGYNRKLLIPDVSNVKAFPLVQWATGQNNPPDMTHKGGIGEKVKEVLTTLSSSGVIAPSIGDYWLALGIKFTSFKLLDSFALLTVSFGTKFEIDLLGLSTLSLPPASSGTAVKVEPVAMAELELKASFSPDTGLVAVEGQLTPQSFILSRDCHLTGGFAFYFWFSGPHQGEFVVTLGGYSPRFTPPAYYPQVPRLGLNWKVYKELTIKGELYFTLTPKAVMAGGGMSAVWESGCVKAWFDVEADFLMVFTPLQYYLSAGVHLGASVRLNLLLTHATITVHLGVGLEIWGAKSPGKALEFSGRAKVDLSIISFTINFGKTESYIKPTIEWHEFIDQLMPSGQSQAGQVMSACAVLNEAPAGNSQTAIIQIAISRGLIKDLGDRAGDIRYIVNGEDFELVTQTAIPIKESLFEGHIQLAPKAQQPQRQEQVIEPCTTFGVGPTGTDSSDFTSKHTITLQSDGDSWLGAVRILENVPKALWEKNNFNKHRVPEIADPLNDTTIRDVLVGFRLVPDVILPDATLDIPLENLEYTIRPEDIQHFKWSSPCYQTADSFSTETVPSTISSAPAKDNRSKLIEAIKKVRPSTSDEIEIGDLADKGTNYLLSSPLLRQLGEQKVTGV
jgi:hypothetical protein